MGTNELSGRRVLVTGASSGVGAAAAVAFARRGCAVALLARSRPGLEVVAERVRGCGAQALVLAVDVSDAAAVSSAVDAVVAEWGGLDVVVVGAAAMAFGAFADVAAEDFDRTVAVTFLGAVNVVRSSLPALEASGGVLVAVGSINARTPLPSFAAYAASKAALRSFLRSLAIELRARRSPVRVAIVNPGAIDTPVWRSVTSATGRLPRRPPEGYRASVIADAVVAMASSPRGEVTVGGEATFWLWLWRTPVLGPFVLGLVHRWYHSGRRAATGNPLWEPSGDGSTSGLPVGRPSLVEALRRRP